MAFQKKYLTKEQAVQKLRQYCAYQERSHAEVVSKMWDLGVYRSDHDEILASLIEDDFLNESRFAEAFVGGRFRMKDWGRKKIYYGLKEKKVSEYIIKKAMQTIDDEAYMKTLRSLAEKKYALLKSEQYLVRKKKDAGLPHAKRLRARPDLGRPRRNHRKDLSHRPRPILPYIFHSKCTT
ncbi:MAG: RecX family transcriptional regulator [Flaviaesturariibacter sp.]|nr:RecX family transcriptional regulator [Flaviaesturariibacter sp.]